MTIRTCKIMVVLLTVIFMQSISFASQEGVLNLSNFAIKSEGIGSSGTVQITGVANNEQAVISLKIEAFGKEYNLSQEELAKIPKGFYNGIQLSYEEGYKELGGKTIYIVLQMGFVSGIRNKVLITFAENGSIKIEEMEAKKS